MAEGLIIGVDGGGTKTQMAVADPLGKIIGFSETGCTNWESPDFNMNHWLDLFNNLQGKKIETAVFTVQVGTMRREGQLQKRILKRPCFANMLKQRM